ncbi:MAG TPA: hypothetical protein VH170_00665 [Chthoniobacterales bacterium]|jgi:hypothetical protein|nr:hypothetical protein [Chthoniobacterales bacterium]
METTDFTLPPFEIPPTADAPVIPPEVYSRWVWQNIKRLRATGKLDELCAARTPVDARFRFPNVS